MFPDAQRQPSCRATRVSSSDTTQDAVRIDDPRKREDSRWNGAAMSEECIGEKDSALRGR